MIVTAWPKDVKPGTGRRPTFLANLVTATTGDASVLSKQLSDRVQDLKSMRVKWAMMKIPRMPQTPAAKYSVLISFAWC
jgi:hypothetical protein